MRSDPNMAKSLFNLRASSPSWSRHSYDGCGMTIMRSQVPFRSATTPVLSIPAPADPALAMPLPGMVPYQYILALEPHAAVSLVIGRFNEGFLNIVVDDDVVRGLNRHYVGYFSKFDSIRHLITDRETLIDDMTWAPYVLKADVSKKIVFQRRPGES
jgi:hypothetical protein